MARQNQDLKIAESKKKKITQDLPSIKQHISSSEDKVEQLLKQQSKLERRLGKKEKEMKLLKELNDKEQQTVHSLRNIISLKEGEITDLKQELEEEIQELNEELKEVKNKLKEAEAQISEYEKQLDKLTSELREKSEEVKLLREANAQTKQELDLEREKVDHLQMQQAAAAQSKENYRSETKVRMILLLCTCVINKILFLNNSH